MSNILNRRQSIGERLRCHWIVQPRIALLPPISDKEIDAFEHANRICIPPDFADYLKHVNGFGRVGVGYKDENGYSFWPLSLVQSIRQYDNGRYFHEDFDDAYVFADYFDFSWGYAIRLHETVGCNDICIIGTAGGSPQTIARSFEEFAELYLANNDNALSPA